MKQQPSSTPPKWLLGIFRWYCDPDFVDDIEGDLIERYTKRTIQGKKLNNLSFAIEVLKLMRPGIVRGVDFKTTHSGMFRNYLISTIRSAKKEKTFSALTILCLTIGFTACIYAGLYTHQELSFDKFHEKADRIYRINQTFIWSDIDKLFGSTGPAVMHALEAEIPEFETLTRVHTYEDMVVSLVDSDKETFFEEGSMRAADSSFFDVFTFPFLHGNPKTALTNPYSLVITEEMALKYFDRTDVLGEQLHIRDPQSENLYQITGVTKNIPHNSHVTFDLLASMNSLEGISGASDTWYWTAFVTFGVLRPDADPQHVAQKVAQVPAKYLGPFLMRYENMTYQEFIDAGKTWDLYIQPLLDIHLRSTNVFSRLNEIGDIKTLYIFNTIAGLILLLSIINFVNLMTARSAQRAKEIGVRKVLGTNKGSLIAQFLTESGLYCLVAMILSLILLKVSLAEVEFLTGKQVKLDELLTLTSILAIVGSTIIISLVAGIYPAFYLSAIAPMKVIKGQLSHGTKSNKIRSVLVTFQFTVSIALIACSVIIQQQVDHWLTMDLGFKKDNILVVQNADLIDSKVFESRIKRMPEVVNVSRSNDTPPYVNHYDREFYIDGKEEDMELSFWRADEQFAPLYGLKIIAGQNFPEGQVNANKVIVDMSLVKSYGYQNPDSILGKTIRYYDSRSEIIGVFENLDTEIGQRKRPLAIFHNEGKVNTGPYEQYSIQWNDNLKPQELVELITKLETEWNNINAGLPMKYYFLDQRFQTIFQSSIDFGRLINFYAILAIIIACLGLVGLVAYVIERRNKEIGIRKVLGASISSVLVLLSSEFGKLLAFGFVLASFISWYMMNIWLEAFTHQIELSPLAFMLSGLFMLMIVLTTLSFQLFKAAKANPVKYLKED